MEQTRSNIKDEPSRGVNVIGHVTGNLGLAVAARNTLFALSESGRPFAAIDIDPGGGRGGHDATWAGHLKTPPEAPYDINLFQLNPPEVIRLAQEPPHWLDLSRRLNVCVPFWELPRLPVKGNWVPLLETVDVVLAPTRFIADAVRTSAPRAKVWHYPQAVFLPADVSSNREAFGLPTGAVLFYVSLDITSDLTRKNPVAVFEAFDRAFDSADNVYLVVKLNNANSFAWAGESAAKIRALLDGNPNVIVINRSMTYREVLSLSASCDVYVSLHRSEGLGLNLLEAMSLGKPVIATAWSGNMDFMTVENSCLIGYDLVPVAAGHPAYQPAAIGPGQQWAEPKIDEAVVWMRRLAGDDTLRASIGARASQDMDELRRRFVAWDLFERLENAFATAEGSHSQAERQAQWARLRRASFPMRVRRWGGRVLRQLGVRR